MNKIFVTLYADQYNSKCHFGERTEYLAKIIRIHEEKMSMKRFLEIINEWERIDGLPKSKKKQVKKDKEIDYKLIECPHNSKFKIKVRRVIK